jgi:hypothetical protein
MRRRVYPAKSIVTSSRDRIGDKKVKDVMDHGSDCRLQEILKFLLTGNELRIEWGVLGEGIPTLHNLFSTVACS